MKISKIIGLQLIISIIILSCSSMDEYKNFIKNGGEIQYTGRIDSVSVYSGRERVMIRGLFLSDPKITECRIYWNSKDTMVSIPIVRSEGVDTLQCILNIPENIYNFEIYTFDNKGYSSVPVYAIGTSYGTEYEKSLPNRIISGLPFYTQEKGLSLKWNSLDKTLGAIRTDITYTNVDGESRTSRISATENQQMINDYKQGTGFTYQTLFRPDTLCLDTFKCVVSKKIFPISDENKINKAGWSILDFNSQEAGGEGPVNGYATALIDDNIDTFWHSQWNGVSYDNKKLPYYISINMGQKQSLVGISLVPRQKKWDAVKDFEVLGSNDGKSWESIGAFSMEQGNVSEQFFPFYAKVSFQYIRLSIKSVFNSDRNAHLSEIYLFGSSD